VAGEIEGAETTEEPKGGSTQKMRRGSHFQNRTSSCWLAFPNPRSEWKHKAWGGAAEPQGDEG
jgi:hypothetical protein